MSKKRRSGSSKRKASRTWPSWHTIVRAVLARHAKPLLLPEIYKAVGRHPRTREAQYWQPKVRQVLQLYPESFARVRPGLWRLVRRRGPKPSKRKTA